VLMFRPQVVEANISLIRKYCRDAKVLFHTVDLHFLRMFRQAAIEKNDELLGRSHEMQKIEYDAIRNSDATIVVSTTEAEILKKDLPNEPISVIPLVLASKYKNIPSFGSRKNIFFVGSFEHAPNIDAVNYFVAEILPLLRAQIKDIVLYVVGANPPFQIQKLNSEGIKVMGYVKDLDSIFNSCRVSIAPLRFGAGIKGKVASSLLAGVPVVATQIAIEGMELTAGENILVADTPESFAQKIIEVYENEIMWEKMSKNGGEAADKLWGLEASKLRVQEMLRRIDSIDIRSNSV